jgi:hypothetical protein
MTVALLLLATVVVAGCAARSKPRLTWVPSADLACDRDADCVVRDTAQGCCPRCDPDVEPFAISARASAAWNALCADAMCTMEYCENPNLPHASAFVAVCTNHVCERSAKL